MHNQASWSRPEVVSNTPDIAPGKLGSKWVHNNLLLDFI